MDTSIDCKLVKDNGFCDEAGLASGCKLSCYLGCVIGGPDHDASHTEGVRLHRCQRMVRLSVRTKPILVRPFGHMVYPEHNALCLLGVRE